MHTMGPTSDRITGKRIKPWVTPSVTMEKKAVKTVRRIALVLKARGIVPRKVDRPPTRMLVPMVSKVSVTLASRDLPGDS